jgi:mRNA interferase RelE/StbE
VEKLWYISESRREQIRHLPPDLKRQVWEAADNIQKDPHAGKPLEEDLAGYRSYRIGRYRLIYRIGVDRLVLEAVGPRSDIYERFVLEIGRAKIRERSAKYSAKPRKRPKRPALRRKRL